MLSRRVRQYRQRGGRGLRGNFITDKNGSNNPNYKDGRKGTRLYEIYNNMKTRCLNPNCPSYYNYGGRGIKICKEWLLDFGAFRSWALANGYRENLTIDRIDVNGNYEPNNCRWATAKVQANNTRSNHLETIDGVTKDLTEWAEFYGINIKTVRDRLLRGWDLKRALTTPADQKYRKRVV